MLKDELSIGMEGDSGYINGERISTIYDYDNEYQDDGVDYVILGVTKTQIFTFGVAWINIVRKIMRSKRGLVRILQL